MSLTFQKRNRSAFANFLRAKYEMLTGVIDVSSRPFYLCLDPSDICQLRCPTCPTGIENESKRRKDAETTLYRAERKKLSMELCDSLLDELGDTLFLINFYNYGEPFLNPRLSEFLRKASDKQIASEVHSNLSLKLSDQRIDEILTAGLGRLSASVDGFSQQAYEVHRVGGNVKLVHENLERLAKARDRLGLETQIIYKFIVFKHNEHEIDDARKFAQDIGVEFALADAFIHDPNWLPSHRKDEEPFYSREQVAALFKRWEAAGHGDYFFEHELTPFWSVLPKEFDSMFPQTCGWHYGISVVTAGGSVSPCCSVSKDKDDFGTVVPDVVSFADIWHNDHFKKSRMAMAGQSTDGMDHVDPVCTRCYLPKFAQHIYDTNDKLVAQRFGEVFGDSEPEMAKAFVLLGDGFGCADTDGFVSHYEQHLRSTCAAT